MLVLVETISQFRMRAIEGYMEIFRLTVGTFFYTVGDWDSKTSEFCFLPLF